MILAAALGCLVACRGRPDPATERTDVAASASVSVTDPDWIEEASRKDAKSQGGEEDPGHDHDRDHGHGHARGDARDQPPAASHQPLFLLFGGDLMFHPQIRSVAVAHGDGDEARGWAWLLREVTPIRERLASSGRVVFTANLESPIATERLAPRQWPPRFNGPAAALAGFRAAGVDVVTVANNHAYDQRREGIAETIAAAEAAGLRTAGGGTRAQAHAPAVLSAADPRVVLLAYAAPQSSSDAADDALPRVAVLDESAEVDVRAARAGAELVVVAVHWVGEFRARPPAGWRGWVARLAEWGADAVIGHGPHVVGPVERLESGGRVVPVVFSLGNLVANMGWGVQPGVEPGASSDSEFRPEAREEALAVLRVEAGAGGWALTGLWMIPLWLEDNRPLAGTGPRREIFPRPMPWCVPDVAAGCFAGASEGWCRGRREMILQRRAALLRTLWGREPEAPAECPPGAEPYVPALEFVPLTGVW